jgi:hypothetical protein
MSDHAKGIPVRGKLVTVDGRTFIVANRPQGLRVYERMVYDPGPAAGGKSYYLRTIGPNGRHKFQSEKGGRKRTSLIHRVLEAANEERN